MGVLVVIAERCVGWNVSMGSIPLLAAVRFCTGGGKFPIKINKHFRQYIQLLFFLKLKTQNK